MVALELFNQMFGSVPDFQQGAVIAVVMLIPSIASVGLMALLERYAIRYNKTAPIELPRGCVRDGVCMGASALVLGGILALFAVIFIVPFVEMWPFRPSFTLHHVAAIFTDAELFSTLTNSIAVAVATAVLGCILAYAAALVVARSNLPRAAKRAVDAISSVINTVPGMVLGIAFLFAFSGTSLQGTFAILVLCNVVHYFATPYQMMKDALTKMNASWETTARLMGDSWVKTILRVVTPNAWPTILQVFGYYFVSSMVTISAVVFLVGARTMVVTTRISALQHIAEFDGIFALSLVILVVNMLVKGLVALACRDRSARSVRTSVRMRGTGRSDALEAEVLLGRPNRMPARRMAGALLIVSVVAVVGIGASLAARERGEDDGAGVPSGQVVIASNGDAEAVEAYRHALDVAGFEGDYIVQSFGTSELGGKLMAEGENLEADIVTMSSYYVDSAQTEQDMFVPLTELELCPLDPNVPVHGVSQPRGARRARRAQRGEGGRYGLGHSRGPVRRRPLDRRGGRQLGDGAHAGGV